MRKDKAEALAICSLIDRAIEKGYPSSREGKVYMKLATDWMEDSRKKKK